MDHGWGFSREFLPPLQLLLHPEGCKQGRASHPATVRLSTQGRPYRAVVADTEGAALPARGSPVEDAAEAELVLQLAQAAGEAASGTAEGLSGAPSAASLASSSA